MKHGIVIREHKNWNTKTIYNDGHVMRTYRRVPKAIVFKSPMVSDFNQHLCGGWSMSEITDDMEATIQQLIGRKKPFGCLSYWDRPDPRTEQRLVAEGLATAVAQRLVACHLSVWDVLACQRIRVAEIGDLAKLEDDYRSADIPIDAKSYADHPLTLFFDGWDSPPLPLWLTGLIWGYPVENTISLYRQ